MYYSQQFSKLGIFIPVQDKENVASIQFSHSVMSDSLQPHGLQHTRPPCPSPATEFTHTHVYWVSDAIQPSHPLLFLHLLLQSFPASGSFTKYFILFWWYLCYYCFYFLYVHENSNLWKIKWLIQAVWVEVKTQEN